MKHILTSLALLICLSASAQVKIGLTAGINKTDGLDKNSDFLQINPRTTFNVGAGIDINISKRLSFEPLILLSNKGWVFEDNLGDETENNLQYLSSQLLAKIHLTNNIKIIGGPEFGYLLQAKSDDASEPVIGIFNEGEMAAIIGLEISLLDKIALHAKYNFGINDVLDLNLTDENGNPVGTSSIKNRAIMVGATIYPFKIQVN